LAYRIVEEFYQIKAGQILRMTKLRTSFHISTFCPLFQKHQMFSGLAHVLFLHRTKYSASVQFQVELPPSQIPRCYDDGATLWPITQRVQLCVALVEISASASNLFS
jgi:hypothetical protein